MDTEQKKQCHDLSVRLLLQIAPMAIGRGAAGGAAGGGRGFGRNARSASSIRTALLCILAVSMVTLLLLALYVQRSGSGSGGAGLARMYARYTLHHLDSNDGGDALRPALDGKASGKDDATPGKGAKKSTSVTKKSQAEGDDEDIFDFVDRTLKKIRQAKQREAIARAESAKRAAEAEEAAPAGAGAANHHDNKVALDAQVREHLDAQIVVGGGGGAMGKGFVPAMVGYTALNDAEQRNGNAPVLHAAMPRANISAANVHGTNRSDVSESSRVAGPGPKNSSAPTAPPAYLWPYQVESEEASNFTAAAWDRFDGVLKERVYKRNRTYYVPETVPFRCWEQRAWTDRCYKTCVSGPGRVPRLVHFLQVGDNVQFLHWLAVMSAVRFIRPDLIIVHYLGEQTTCWARRIQSHPLVVLKPITANLLPTALNGANITELAHRADLLRLTILWQYGGIYMDFDALITKSFDPLLYQEAVVSNQITDELGNGLMVSRPHSCFICGYAKRACHNFDGRWTTHSVWTLTRMMRYERHLFPGVQILKANEGFFPFCYTPEYLDRLFNWDTDLAGFDISKVFALHLYNKMSQHYSEKLSYDWIVMQRSAVAQVAQRILPYGFRREHMDRLRCLPVPLVLPL